MMEEPGNGQNELMAFNEQQTLLTSNGIINSSTFQNENKLL